MTLRGSLNDYDAAAQHAMCARVAASVGVDVKRVSVRLVAASVRAVFAVATVDESQACVVFAALADGMGDVAAASALLAIEVEAVSDVAIIFPTDASCSDLSTGNAHNGGSKNVLRTMGAVTGTAVGLAAICGLALLRRRRRNMTTSMNASSPGSSHTAASAPACSVTACIVEPAPLPPPTASHRTDRLNGGERQWEWASADVKWGHRLGGGSFGNVYVVESGGMVLAAKCTMLTDPQQRDASVKLMRREALALRRLDHANVVRIVAVVLDHPAYIALLMELADLGSLRGAMDTHRDLFLGRCRPGSTPPSPVPCVAPVLRLALHIARGMAFLHAQERPLLHHDLKSANVVLFSERGDGELTEGTIGSITAKLCDFGLATGLNASSIMLQSTRTGGGQGGGTLAYTAPEAFDEGYAAPAEVYAYGILLWELLTCDIPWAINTVTGRPHTQATLMRAVLAGARPPLDETSAAAGDEEVDTMRSAAGILGSLAQHCWQGNADARPSFEMVTRQLELACRQSAAVGSTILSGGTAMRSSPMELDDGAEAGRVQSAQGRRRLLQQGNERRLQYTLRYDVHRSHKQSYNDVHKTKAGRIGARTGAARSSGTATAALAVAPPPAPACRASTSASGVPAAVTAVCDATAACDATLTQYI